MAKITQLKDQIGTEVYPKSTTSAIYDNNGKSLDAIMDTQVYLDSQMSKVVDPVNTVDAATLGTHGPEYYAKQSVMVALDNERKTEIDVERTRIDELIKLPAGSTTGDAELIDARVQADGTVADSLGDAIRNQMRDCNAVEVSDTEPTKEYVTMWVDTSSDEEVQLPEIKDDEISTEDTWSSSKINDAINELNLKIDSIDPSGGGTGGDLSELVDIRTKADGTVADTAGNAVREQITELNEKLELKYDIIVQAEENTHIDPNTTTLPRVRTSHANCPDTNAYWDIFTMFTDNTSEICEKHQIAIRAYSNISNESPIVIYGRSKNYEQEWKPWDKIAMGSELNVVNENLATKNLKTYITLSQLGITDVSTITSLNGLVPYQSELVCDIGLDSVDTLYNNGIIPVNRAGILNVTNMGRGTAIYTTFEGAVYTCVSNNADSQEWKPWDKIAMGSELDTKVDKNGDTMTGDLTISQSNYNANVIVKSPTRQIALFAQNEENGNAIGLWDENNRKKIVYSDVDGNVFVDDHMQKLQTMTELSDINCSADNTITEIMTALPIYTEMITGTSAIVTNLNTSLGVGGAAGILICRKFGANRGEVIWRRTLSPATILTWGWHEGTLSSCQRIALDSDIHELGMNSLSTGKYVGSFDLLATELERLGAYYISSTSDVVTYNAPCIGYGIAFGQATNRYTIIHVSNDGAEMWIRTHNMAEFKKFGLPTTEHITSHVTLSDKMSTTYTKVTRSGNVVTVTLRVDDVITASENFITGLPNPMTHLLGIPLINSSTGTADSYMNLYAGESGALLQNMLAKDNAARVTTFTYVTA